MVEKTLESLNDVFTDIVNVLLFNGKEVIREEDLVPATLHSIFKAEQGKLHEQERDVAKYWTKGNVRIALCGIENQTNPDRDMPLRVLSYDGASYKEQVLRHVDERKQKISRSPVYPSITIVLYFGVKPWTAPKTLCGCFGPNIPAELAPYVNDYKIHVFEVAFLKPEQIAMFKSDFGIIAEHFVQIRSGGDYIPSKKVIRHVDEFLKMLAAISGDKKYDYVREGNQLKGEEAVTMCQILDQVEKNATIKVYWELVREKIFTLAEAAKRINMSESDFLHSVKGMNLPM